MLAEKNRQGQSKRRIGPLKKESIVSSLSCWEASWAAVAQHQHSSMGLDPPTSNSGRKKWSLTGRNLKAGPGSWGQGDTERGKILMPE